MTVLILNRSCALPTRLFEALHQQPNPAFAAGGRRTKGRDSSVRRHTGRPQLKRRSLGGMHLLEFLGLVPKGNHSALRFSEPEHWAVGATKDGAAFFRSLVPLAPRASVLYLEDTTDPRFPQLLTPLEVPKPTQVQLATIFPKPDYYHVPATGEVLNALATLTEASGTAFPAIHVALYDEAGLLLSWLDAFFDDAMRLSGRLAEDQVRAFAARLEVSYWWLKHAA
jgi:hypothetical protein